MQQEDDTDQCDDDALLEQGMLERRDSGIDQGRAIVDRNNLDRLRQAARDLLEPFLDVVDDVEGVEAKSLQNDAAGDLSFSV